MAVLALAGPAHAQRDMALLGELHRIGDEVDQDLAQMLAAAAQEKGCGGIEMHQQAQALALGLGPQEGDQIGELGMEIEIDDVDRHLARLDLGEIEDLVDEGEQRAAGARDRAGHVALLARRGGYPGAGRSCR